MCFVLETGFVLVNAVGLHHNVCCADSRVMTRDGMLGTAAVTRILGVDYKIFDDMEGGNTNHRATVLYCTITSVSGTFLLRADDR